MNDDDPCAGMNPRNDYCFVAIDTNTNFDFLVDYEDIKVFYNESILSSAKNLIPASLEKYKDLIQINGYHTAVGFQSNSYAFTIDLIIPKGIAASLYPNIKDDNIIWNNQNLLTYNDANSIIYIDPNTPSDTPPNTPYWDRSTYITTITKSIFMNVLKDIKTYLDTYPRYALFNVVRPTNIDLLYPELKGVTCDSFAYFVLNKLQTYGAKVDIMVPPKSNIVAYVADSIKILDITNPVDKKEIITFYKMYNIAFKQIVQEIQSISTTPSLEIPVLINAINAKISDLLNHKFIYYCYGKDSKLNYYELTLNSTQHQQLIVAYTYGLLKNDVKHYSIFGIHPTPGPNPNACPTCPKCPDIPACPVIPDCPSCPTLPICPTPTGNNKSINITSIIFIIISIILTIILIFTFIYIRSKHI
jgi:hypothetical protein